MVQIVSMVDSEDLKSHFDAQEISIICSQVSEHILKLLSFQYGSKPESRKIIDGINTLLQLRLGVLGRIATEDIQDEPNLKAQTIIFTTKTFNDEDEIVEMSHEHGLDKTSFGQLSPEMTLDFLLILLEEGTKAIRSTLSDPRYIQYGKDCVTTYRDMLSELRPLAKISYLPKTDPNVLLVTLMVVVDTNMPVIR